MTNQETPIESKTQIKTPQSKKKKRVRGNAIDRLAKATARRVRDRSAELSDALFNRALEGDVSCAKLLVTLVEKCPPPKRRFRSLALEWANSSEWKDPEDNADADGENLEADDAGNLLKRTDLFAGTNSADWDD
jgi:hypothetical protein